MKKHKMKLEENLSLILAFVIPVLIMLGVFAGNGIYPFGSQSFLRTDLYHQYAPFFESFSHKLQNHESLTYAFDIGLGSNYAALYAYYLSSPFHFLAALVPDGFIIEFVSYMVVIKIGLCGFFMAWYLKKHFHTQHIGITFCGICYALSGYMAAYSWNIMWLDVLWLTPIVIYGLEKLVHEDKPFLYGISLALAIACNYYIAIMLCIFLVLYFISQLALLKEYHAAGVLKKIFNFGLFSLLAGGMAAVLLLPAAYALSSTASADSTFPKKLECYFSILDMLSRHLVVVDVEIGLDHWPNLYSGAAVLVLLPLYYTNRKVPMKEKIVNSVLLFIFLISFSFNILNYIWHGFHYPNSLPCRQSFLYTFILLKMCFDGIRNIRTSSVRTFGACLWGAILFIFLVEKVCDPEEIPFYACYASIAFVALYALFAWLYRTGHFSRRNASIAIFGLLVIEMILNTAVTSVTTVSRTDYVRYDQAFSELIDKASENELFTRIERTNRRTKNDGVYFGYNSASIFSSTTHAGITDFYKAVGMEGNTNAYAFNGATPLMSSLLSVKYMISDKELPESRLYQLISEAVDKKDKTFYLYENNYTLPLGFLIDADTDALWNTSLDSPASVQNSFVNIAAGTSNILIPVIGSASSNTYQITASEDGNIFVYVSNSSIKKVTATIGSRSQTYENVNRHYLLDLGWCEAGTSITLRSEQDTTFNASAYIFDENAFINAYDKLSGSPFVMTEFTNTLSKTEIVGRISAAENQILFTSIPYEKGWTAYVDGVETETQCFSDAFLSVPVTAGDHEIRLTYQPEGLKTGAIVSLGSALIFLLCFAFSRKKTAASGSEDPSPDTDVSESAKETAGTADCPGHDAPEASETDPLPSEETPALSADTLPAESGDTDSDQDVIESMDYKKDLEESRKCRKAAGLAPDPTATTPEEELQMEAVLSQLADQPVSGRDPESSDEK